MNKLNSNKGAGCLALTFSLLFFLLVGRFLWIETVGILHGHSVKQMAKEQQSHTGVLEARRGTIFDQNGQVLAQDVTSFKLVATLKGDEVVADKEETAKKLAAVLETSEQDILERLNHPNARQVEFGSAGRTLSKEQKQKIEAMKLKGISFVEGNMRNYPNGDFASYILGYAKPDDKGVLEGQFGLEKSLDKYLHAENGSIEYQGDARGYSLINGTQNVKAPRNGAQVYLTLDQRIQSFLEDAMTKAAEQYKPSMLAGIVADPKTGKILAMSSRPSYDPNKRNIEYFLNDPIAYAYEPGSTMKIFTLAAAVNEGVYNGEERYQSGKYSVGGTYIGDHNNGFGWGSITFNEGVQRSSNVAFAILAEKKLGFDRYRQYLHKFGLDQPTGIDLPGEGKNTILFDKPIQQVTTAFGQGSTVTPIQQIQAATAVANGGKMMKPYVVEKIMDPETQKVLLEQKPEVVGEPITEETAKTVRGLLETVITSPKGTGTMYRMEGYSVAGKTGTAQIPGEHGYLQGRENYIFSFMGMAPAADPDLLVYVAIKQPKLQDGQYGATPLADIFKSVTKNSLEYLQVKPSSGDHMKQLLKEQSVKVPNVAGKSKEEATKLLEQAGLQVVALSNDNVTAQYPAAGDTVLKGDRVLLAGDSNAMPNIKGWSLGTVNGLAHLLGLQLTTDGKGFAAEQSIQEGSPLRKEDVLTVKLAPPLEAGTD
ncbi:penicillin-binding protein [Ectobacillus ponti]|uniref:serine-type D-Ala-D-Ala carboxypeptidase n=1 Tax=Ectobacillus ponti TaxID=2961894 RepID=A0AA41XB55_9BACI|nr:PASTA domain-containing penicillin-binding protein [Ectobacillus ponti]MCP8970250.1 penicillin-binding transpeptidase domain-containing protein [Ectobacillus ponti]